MKLKRYSFTIAAAVLVFAFLSQTSQAGVTTYADSIFDSNDWEFDYLDTGEKVADNEFCQRAPFGSCAVSNVIASPPDTRTPYVGGSLFLAPSNGDARVHATLLNKNATWDPATQPEITQIDWSVDTRILTRHTIRLSDLAEMEQNLLNGWSVQALIMQDNNYFTRRLGFACDGDDAACRQWHNVSRSFFDSNLRFNPLVGSPTLDLSPSGSELTFGLIYAESGNHSDHRVNRSTGQLDNWSVTIHTVPEPWFGPWQVIVSALCGLRLFAPNARSKSQTQRNPSESD